MNSILALAAVLGIGVGSAYLLAANTHFVLPGTLPMLVGQDGRSPTATTRVYCRGPAQAGVPAPLRARSAVLAG